MQRCLVARVAFLVSMSSGSRCGRVAFLASLGLAACGPTVSTTPEENTSSEAGTTEADALTSGALTATGAVETNGGESTMAMSSSGAGSGDTTAATTGTVDVCESYRQGDCTDDAQLRDVSVSVVSNSFGREDVPLEFDASRGSVACWGLSPTGGVRIEVFLGPFDICEPQTRVTLTVYDGARLYDLETDPGPPGMLEPGLVRLGGSYEPTFAFHTSYDTINSRGFGTVDVRELPTDEGVRFEFHAVGWVGAADGWVFDLEVGAAGE